jgi:hypothetical protein
VLVLVLALVQALVLVQEAARLAVDWEVALTELEVPQVE